MKYVKVYLDATFLALARYLLPFKFSIMPMVMVWITHTMDYMPIFLSYSDDNKDFKEHISQR